MNKDIVKNQSVIMIDNDISVDLICSSVLSFVKKLPYSIDPMSKDFVPGFLFNVIPNDSQNYSAFQQHNYETLFSIMKNWRDSRKAAYSIQICLMLQLMLTNDKKISIETGENIADGLSVEDSNILKNTLNKLNYYYELIKKSNTQEERTKYIEEFYQILKANYSNCSAYNDLKMFYYFFNLPSDTEFIWENNKNLTESTIKIVRK